LKYKGAPTRVRIGDDNVFREHVTINRSTSLNEETIIGSNSFLMANCHVGHNCVIGDHVIIANGALLGGHVTVQDRAFISGNCLVHQFTRVGALAMMRGGAGISKDLPPFTIAKGDNSICGLNVVGLRRAGFSVEDRMGLKRLYRALFRSGRNLRPALEEAQQLATGAAGKAFLKFISEAKRGVCTDVSRTASAGVEEE
jgi:UDP-N-acetylglucosamine acyltransferase